MAKLDIIIQEPTGRLMMVEAGITAKDGYFYRSGVVQEGFLSGFENPYVGAIPNDGNLTLIKNVEVPDGVTAHDYRYDRVSGKFISYEFVGGEIAGEVADLKAKVDALASK